MGMCMVSYPEWQACEIGNLKIFLRLLFRLSFQSLALSLRYCLQMGGLTWLLVLDNLVHSARISAWTWTQEPTIQYINSCPVMYLD
jgi:hypothetical protein